MMVVAIIAWAVTSAPSGSAQRWNQNFEFVVMRVCGGTLHRGVGCEHAVHHSVWSACLRVKRDLHEHYDRGAGIHLAQVGLIARGPGVHRL